MATPECRDRIRGLYLLTDSSVGDASALAALVAAAVAGGARVVQYRDKGADGPRRLREARAVLAACRAGGALCLINDDVELALAVGADGVHLGAADAALAAARARLGPAAVIGISCYDSLPRARAAAAAGADYVAFGAFYPTAVKPDAPRPPPDLLSAAKAELALPVVAIGGISAANLAPLAAAGADAVAVIGAVCAAADPGEAAAELSRAFAAARRPADDLTISANHQPKDTRPAMTRSELLFEQAQQSIVGGVNSPVRAFRSVGGTPIFFARGEGPYLYDVDGQRYVDYVNTWGPAVVGHAHPAVLAAVQRTAANGLSFGAPTEIEVAMAELLRGLVPSMELVRMVSSGTEATMSALRLARGFTGRDKILKFEGCYHGHADPLLVKAGSGALTLGVPSSAGVPAAATADTLTATYNDLDSVRAVFNECGGQIAAIIVEPVAGNMNCIPPLPGFLEGLRALCDQHGSVLIFDEVMCGFRVALGGAQARYNVRPDLTCLGKVVGGGLPVGAFGGRREIMEQLAPLGPVYQAGTLSGNPVAMAAGMATLEQLGRPGMFERLEAATHELAEGLRLAAAKAGVPLVVNEVGSMFGIFFTNAVTVSSYQQVMESDAEAFKRFFHAMLAEGVYLAPSAFEAGFVSTAHDPEAIGHTLRAAERAFEVVARG